MRDLNTQEIQQVDGGGDVLDHTVGAVGGAATGVTVVGLAAGISSGGTITLAAAAAASLTPVGLAVVVTSAIIGAVFFGDD